MSATLLPSTPSPAPAAPAPLTFHGALPELEQTIARYVHSLYTGDPAKDDIRLINTAVSAMARFLAMCEKYEASPLHPDANPAPAGQDACQEVEGLAAGEPARFPGTILPILPALPASLSAHRAPHSAPLASDPDGDHDSGDDEDDDE